MTREIIDETLIFRGEKTRRQLANASTSCPAFKDGLAEKFEIENILAVRISRW